MYTEIIELNNLYPNISKCTLEINYPYDIDWDMKIKPAMLIIPGGGYAFCSQREKDPIALSFMLKGYVCFSLIYSVTGDGSQVPLYPQPQLQALAALDFIKRNAEKYFVDSSKVFVVGFSAGGHLAGTLGYLHKDQELLNLLGICNDFSIKPSGLCLCYPVITLKKKTHGGSMEALTNMEPELIEKLSIENWVSEDYPPTFIWTTKEDQCVPIENSIMMNDVLQANNVRHKFILFPHGPHGLSLATDLVCEKSYDDVAVWVDEADKFFKI